MGRIEGAPSEADALRALDAIAGWLRATGVEDRGELLATVRRALAARSEGAASGETREREAYDTGYGNGRAHRDGDWTEAIKLMVEHLMSHGIESLRTALRTGTPAAQPKEVIEETLTPLPWYGGDPAFVQTMWVCAVCGFKRCVNVGGNEACRGPSEGARDAEEEGEK